MCSQGFWPRGQAWRIRAPGAWARGKKRKARRENFPPSAGEAAEKETRHRLNRQKKKKECTGPEKEAPKEKTSQGGTGKEETSKGSAEKGTPKRENLQRRHRKRAAYQSAALFTLFYKFIHSVTQIANGLLVVLFHRFDNTVAQVIL